MGALIRAHDWSSTPLGPIDAWPQSLRTAIDIMLTSRFAMWMLWGRDLTFLCNDAYRPTLGIKGDRALGARSDAVWAEIWDDIGPRIRAVLDEGEATWDEGLLLFLERSGYPEETYHTFSYSPLRDDAGAIAGMLCVVTEDTERVIADRRLDTLRLLAAELSIVQTQPEVGRAVERAMGANRRDLPFSLLYLFTEDGQQAELAAVTGIDADHAAAPTTIGLGDREGPWPAAKVRDSGASLILDDLASLGNLPTGDWNEPPRKAAVYPIAQQGGVAPAGLLVVALNPFRLLDRTYADFIGLLAGQIAASLANVRAYEQERRRADALAEIDRAKTAFFSNVSHEFRTPLTLMLGPLEEVMAGASVDLGLITTAHRNCLRLLKLVNTLLDFSRIEAGRAQANFESVDLAALTADLASSFRSAMERAGLEFVVETPPLPQPVHVDRDMWEKIVLNLLSNAFKFTFDGRVAVTLAPSPDGSAVLLEVRDTGTGVPAHEVPRLFERFHRVVGAHGRTFEGSGIGLALVKELVGLHGGTITVESEEGRGTAFILSLPFGTEHLPADRIDAGRPAVSSAVRAQAYVEEALRWLPDSDAVNEVGFIRSEELGTAALVSATTGGRVLLADDNADMRDYVRRLLVGQGYDVEAVSDGEAALAAARRHMPDLVLSDVMMPRLDGFGLLESLRADQSLRDLPVILLSARAGEESRVAGMAAGADDYLTKPFSARELLARVGANLATARLRREAMEAMRSLNETLAQRVAERTRERDSIWRLSRELMLVVTPDSTALAVNPAWEEVLGWTESDLVGQATSTLLHPDDSAATAAEMGNLAEGLPVRQFENRVRHRDGSYRTIAWTAVPDEGVIYSVGRDVTEAKNIEERLRQAQKMETIGQLTGGVAHDFNNLLTVVCGNVEIIQRNATLLEGDGASSRIRSAADNAMRGAQRATVLTQRLLAFSRRQPLDPKPVNVNRLVAGMSDLLQRTLGEHIDIETVLGGGLWWTSADPNQLESALLNLAVNARDAMAEVGKLTIETANSHLDERYANDHAEVLPGQYVQIAVSDTGSGMTRAVLARAFEPFFTTKDVGHGTGLGLSQVYGFVKQSGGHVKVYSEVGLGTTIRIYLPRLSAGYEQVEADEPQEEHAPQGELAEMVLVIEDDPDVRLYTVELIRDLGYLVLEAPDGGAALELLRREPGVGLLFTDVGLPGGMNGRQLAEAARALRPELPVLFTTGYARNAIVHGGRLDPGVQLITKPFTRAALAVKLREVLDAAPTPACILLVEDEALIRMVAADMLSAAGCQVVEAGDASEAVAKLRGEGNRIAVAILDYSLPDGTADALADELRALRADLPLVITTGHGEAEMRSRFANVPGVAFVPKPYRASTLLQALRELGVKGLRGAVSPSGT